MQPPLLGKAGGARAVEEHLKHHQKEESNYVSNIFVDQNASRPPALKRAPFCCLVVRVAHFCSNKCHLSTAERTELVCALQ